jgi:hypothetical protein
MPWRGLPPGPGRGCTPGGGGPASASAPAGILPDPHNVANWQKIRPLNSNGARKNLSRRTNMQNLADFPNKSQNLKKYFFPCPLCTHWENQIAEDLTDISFKHLVFNKNNLKEAYHRGLKIYVSGGIFLQENLDFECDC